LLQATRGRAAVPRWGVLNRMRDRTGAPTVLVRVLAVLLVLLLGGPLTVLLVRAAERALDLAL